ncbi:MAG TPA: general stress protein, partial [Actinomycetaceae bacterium]|nr:general stress protein [Actinomycetaceae bacterium]
MTINRGSNLPPTPTLPSGIEVASFNTYLEAQRAVDALSDKQFPVQHTVIVGTDLRMVERITGRLSYPRVALAGAMSGAWFGLFVGLIFGLFSENFLQPLIPAILIGAAFGISFGLVSYAFTGGKRDFTSSSQVVASRYALLSEPEHAG